MLHMLVVIPVALLFIFAIVNQKRTAHDNDELRRNACLFATCILDGQVPPEVVTSYLACRDEPFDHALASPAFFQMYGDRVTYRGAVLQSQQELHRRGSEPWAGSDRYSEEHYKCLTDQIQSFLAEASPTWGAVRRTLTDLDGDQRHMKLAEILRFDVLTMMSAFAACEGTVTTPIAIVYRATSRAWGHSGTLEDKADEIRRFSHGELGLPMTIHALRITDKLTGSNLGQQAAKVFQEVLNFTAECCADSLPVREVTRTYAESFASYFCGQESSSSQDIAAEGQLHEDCSECRRAYDLLELPFGADKEQVRAARRELARNFHPDFFGEKRGRRSAEELLKDINVASDHLLQCRPDFVSGD